MAVRVFGIRHHGPGSARALASSLGAWQPDAVLIEGPPEAESILGLAASPAMRPPVALLGYAPGKPARSAFYPMAGWSPEWVALRHALATGAAVKMIDLPAGVMLAGQPPYPPHPPHPPHPAQPPDPQAAAPDPFSRLAALGGYDDPERWWEDMIEHRCGEEPWDAVNEAVAEIRAGAGPHDRSWEARREASMRQGIRAAEKTHARVAVVCGAWHAPALLERGPARPDRDLLTGLRREKVAFTWVPWTNDRLSVASGYGAGLTSPGWYEHLFASPDRPIERWMVKVAALLRAEQIDAPPASVIDAVRLAETLATMRGRPLAGLPECTDSARAALTGGHDEALALIGRKLVVGEVLGQVPAETPMVPLAADLAAHQRRLRLKPLPVLKTLDLDLRKETDLQRSHLLHRLGLLGIPWGVPTDGPAGTGTFRETWSLGWQPEMAVRVIEASVYGMTVEAAASARGVEGARRVDDLAGVTQLIERCLLADLPVAVAAAMSTLDEKAALSNDVTELMAAIPPLARVMRYGTVRRTDAEAVEGVVRGVVARVSVSLAPACASLDDDAATLMTQRVWAVSSAVAALDDRELRDLWMGALMKVSGMAGLHGLLAGRCSRILLDAGRLTARDVADRLAAALSHGEDPGRGAAWVEGLVSGSGLLLVHDPELLAVLDSWLATASDAAFDDVVPLLRRSFATFETAERRMIAEAAARLGGQASASAPRRTAAEPEPIDEARAEAVIPVLELLLGALEEP
jgi:Family of unknown function (DUF5682)